MTPTEGFDSWWKKTMKRQGYPMGEEVWLAACQFQREQDAEIAERLPQLLRDACIESLAVKRSIAVAIREQVGG